MTQAAEGGLEIQRKLIKRLLEKQTRPDNILLLGQTGAGKSSLVNTISQAITTEWLPQAAVGNSGAAEPVTDSVTWYHHCNVKGNSRQLPEALLPNIIDMPGFAGHELGAWTKILQGVIDGRLTDNTSITALLDKLAVHPRYIEACDVDESKRISKIVFVCTVTEEVNEELARIVLKVACPRDGTGREIPVYGAVTHSDLIGRKVSYSEARKRMSTVISALQKNNAHTDYVMGTTSYSSDLHPRNTRVEAEMLEFVRKILIQEAKLGQGRNSNNLGLKNRIKLRWLETHQPNTYIYASIILLILTVLLPYIMIPILIVLLILYFCI